MLLNVFPNVQMDTKLVEMFVLRPHFAIHHVIHVRAKTTLINVCHAQAHSQLLFHTVA
jgi:hypothetical protein